MIDVEQYLAEQIPSRRFHSNTVSSDMSQRPAATAAGVYRSLTVVRLQQPSGRP